MTSTIVQGTHAQTATSPTIAAALAVEDASLRNHLRRDARAAALLEMAVLGLDVDTLPILAIEDAIEAGEDELTTDPADHRVIALHRAIATLRAALDDEAPALAVAA